MDQRELIQIAASLAQPFTPSEDCTAGTVAAALVTGAGNVYTGVCIDTACSLGFCAEHAAVAEMLKARESAVRIVVAVNSAGEILPPCGRCRELLWQLDRRNTTTWVVLAAGEGAMLAELLPRR
jgi:cytidine deaminase